MFVARKKLRVGVLQLALVIQAISYFFQLSVIQIYSNTVFKEIYPFFVQGYDYVGIFFFVV